MIGILISTHDSYVGVNTRYVLLAEKIANTLNLGVESIKFISPLENYNEDISFLIIPGGADVDPENEVTFMTRRTNPQLNFFDKNVLPLYMANGIPMLGICRGMQILWKELGGDIVQHVDIDISSSIVDLTNEKFVYKQGNTDVKMSINSRHHQICIKSDNLNTEVKILGYSDKFANIEAFECGNILGVQWHPEYLSDNEWLLNKIEEIYGSSYDEESEYIREIQMVS